MTRKEAIEELKAILEMDYKNVPLSKAALEMAISSLETDEAYQLEYESTTKDNVPENNAENIYICSCGFGWDKSKVVRYHFCPNCGKAVASATKNDLADDKTFYEQIVEYCNEHFLVLVEKDVWEDARKALTTKNDLAVDSTPNTISFKEMMDNLKITAEDIENAENLEYSIEPLICPKNDLAVSKGSVLDALRCCYDTETFTDSVTGTEYIDYNQAVELVNELPSVTPQESKTGHWVLTDVEGNKVWHCHCSECGKDPQDYIGGSENWWLIKNKLPKFCPSCGSRNEVEE